MSDVMSGMPEARLLPPEGAFELGLALAGAVSGGAYAAGVIDFLLEALDAWEQQKQRDQAEGTALAPTHKLQIRVVSGASAGSINGALLAIAARYHIKPVRMESRGGPLANPFYATWVQGVDISGLLGTRDLEASGKIVSLLDSTCLDRVGDEALQFTAAPRSAPAPFLADPLKLIFTVTNLRGVPYSINFQGSHVNMLQKFGMAAHSDYLKFACSVAEAPDWQACQPDECHLSGPNHPDHPGWKALMSAVLASAAFPLGLAPRQILRPVTDYLQRTVVVTGEKGQSQSVPLLPDDALPREGDYAFVAVDGGCMDNEPLELARTELAGRLAHNPREGDKACRAVVMIDPFPEPESLGADSVKDFNLLDAAGSLFTAWKQQARFRPADVALASAENVYSRFLISPVRYDAQDVRYNGADAMAAGRLEGFSGFLSQDFREHDYFLGRANCQRFLQKHLAVPVSNPVVAGWAANPAYASLLIREAGKPVHAPLIPLMPHLLPAADGVSRREQVPPWPVGKIEVPRLLQQIDRRFEAMYQTLLHDHGTEWLRALAWKLLISKKLKRFIGGKLSKDLGDLLTANQRKQLS